MAAVAKVKLNRKGVSQLLKSNEVRADLASRASRIASAAGEGMEADSGVGSRRARASVRTASGAAVRAEASHRALTRALDAGRD